MKMAEKEKKVLGQKRRVMDCSDDHVRVVRIHSLKG